MKKLFFGKNTTIAVIGYGRFGQLLVEILLGSTQIKIIVISSKKINLVNKNLKQVSIDDIKNADIIIPCVPISKFESVIKRISPLIKNGATVMDICSVKTEPVKIMKKHLPSSIQIIATHPMFGPDSYDMKKNVKDLRLVLWNIRAKEENYLQIKDFLINLGMRIIELSPQDHDKFLALSLGYSYLIGKIGQRMNIKKTPIDTYDFQLLLEHEAIIEKDSEQLFFDMQSQNPFTKNMLTKFNKTLNQILTEIKRSN
jgi:prephenate dehydrogenase